MTDYFYFISKLIGRIIHVICFIFIFGNVSYDLFFFKRVSNENPKRSSYNALNISLWILVILSGLTNMLLLIFEKKYERNTHYEVWKKSLIAKFLISIFMSPALEGLISINQSDADKVDSIALPIRFTILLIFTLGSSFLRYYREYFMSSISESYIK